MRIRKNDLVVAIKGKDRGKQGKVQRALPKESRVVVEGISMISKHSKARPGTRQAGIVHRESPIHVSNVMIICTHCNKPARVGYKLLEDKTKARVCKRCQEVIE
ncbi:MAG: 50S ribosomal protein L24 [Chloroflexi bacterium]|nr:50S ribosomal protein L24 [Chloroflexota bacterium]